MDQPKRTGFFNKFIAGNFSESEHDEFVQWVQQANKAELEHTWDLFSSIEAGHPDHEAPPVSFREALERRLDEVEQPKRIRRIWWYAAASVVLLGGLSLFYWLSQRQPTQQIPTVAASQPDSIKNINKATLTLSNGKTISLNNIPAGQLAQENGVSVEKDSNGQLLYSVNSTGTASAMPTYNTITTARGGQYQVSLPDGSNVWLNAASSLSFPVNFSAKQRRVSVTGEAYFEIAKKKDQPFIVQTGRQEVEVLGTAFNVNNYEQEAIRTSLVEGSVKVSNTSTKEQVLLKPGSQSELGLQQIRVNRFDEEMVTGWRKGLFTYYNAPLTAVMADFERWYDVDVIFAGKVPGFDFKGQIPRKFSVSQFLEVMSNYPVQFKMDTINNRQRLVVSAR